MKNFFHSQDEWDTAYVYGSSDLVIFVGRGVIPKCDENCLVVTNHKYLGRVTKLCCLSFEKAEYYPHGEIEGVEEWKLNKEEKERLLSILKSPQQYDPDYTLFQRAIGELNDYNEDDDSSTYHLPEDTPMPDYTQLPEE